MPQAALAALARWSDLLHHPVGQDGLVVLFSYFLATVEVQPEAVHAAFAPRPHGPPDSTMKTAAQYLIEEGQQKGRVAVAKTLRTVLERRFGPIDADLEARIAAADLDQLLEWMAKAALVTDRGAVFEG